MNHALQSDQVGEIAASLSKAQSDMNHAQKDSQNPHFKASFASLASVIDAVREPFGKHGLSFTQTMLKEGGDLILVTTLFHASGQWIRGYTPILADKNTAQAMGSATSYARRYALSAIAGLSQTDDDGHAASQAPLPQKTSQAKPIPAPFAHVPGAASELVNRALIIQLAKKFKWADSEIRAVIQEHFRCETSNELTADQFAELAGMIKSGTAEDHLKVIRATNKAKSRKSDDDELPDWNEPMAEWPETKGMK